MGSLWALGTSAFPVPRTTRSLYGTYGQGRRIHSLSAGNLFIVTHTSHSRAAEAGCWSRRCWSLCCTEDPELRHGIAQPLASSTEGFLVLDLQHQADQFLVYIYIYMASVFSFSLS